MVVTLLIAAVSFALTAALLPGLTVSSVWSAFAAVLAIGAFNLVIRGGILLLVAGRSPVLMGIFVLLLQVVAFFVVANLVPGVQVDRILTAFFASFIYAAFNSV